MMGGPSGPGGMMMQPPGGVHGPCPGGPEQQVNPFPFYGHDPSENGEFYIQGSESLKTFFNMF